MHSNGLSRYQRQGDTGVGFLLFSLAVLYVFSKRIGILTLQRKVTGAIKAVMKGHAELRSQAVAEDMNLHQVIVDHFHNNKCCQAVQKHLKTFCHRERKKTRDHNVEHIDLASAKGIEDKHLKLLKTKTQGMRPNVIPYESVLSALTRITHEEGLRELRIFISLWIAVKAFVVNQKFFLIIVTLKLYILGLSTCAIQRRVALTFDKLNG
ncbi:unnamed protein product [Vicia faba]|uniref:Uncharacterized protein n=1 Tax=Vicia faba TaxID=3906 RepID=A0AAV1BD63_VICFA|nr:unnamed protein product [Vicia faba]